MAKKMYVKDDEVFIRTPKDVDEAMFLINWHYSQAAMRGDVIIVEIWSPHIQKGEELCNLHLKEETR